MDRTAMLAQQNMLIQVDRVSYAAYVRSVEPSPDPAPEELERVRQQQRALLEADPYFREALSKPLPVRYERVKPMTLAEFRASRGGLAAAAEPEPGQAPGATRPTPSKLAIEAVFHPEHLQLTYDTHIRRILWVAPATSANFKFTSELAPQVKAVRRALTRLVLDHPGKKFNSAALTEAAAAEVPDGDQKFLVGAVRRWWTSKLHMGGHTVITIPAKGTVLTSKLMEITVRDAPNTEEPAPEGTAAAA